MVMLALDKALKMVGEGIQESGWLSSPGESRSQHIGES